MTTVLAELKVEEFVRFFEAGGGIYVVSTGGRSVQELVELSRKSSLVALQTFLVVEGEAIVQKRKAISVKSDEFDHSPRYYINGEVFPFSEVHEHYRPLIDRVKNPQFGVRTRFGLWAFEHERPEVIKIS